MLKSFSLKILLCLVLLGLWALPVFGQGKTGWAVGGSKKIDGDTIAIFLKPVLIGCWMLNSVMFDSDGSLRYKLLLKKPFSQNPSLELSPMSSKKRYKYNFYPVANGYEVILADSAMTRPESAYFTFSLGYEGSIRVTGVDDGVNKFFVDNEYDVVRKQIKHIDYMREDFPDTFFPFTITGGFCDLLLDTLNTFDKILILSSEFPPPLSGLDSLSEQVGEIFSICAYPSVSNLKGLGNILVIGYAHSDLKKNPESCLRIFKWNEAYNQWECIGGDVSGEHGVVVAHIQSLGIYGVFTTSLSCDDTIGN